MSSDDPTPAESTAQSRDHRVRNRAARRQAFVDTARWIVTAHGVDALTMQRVAFELDCGVGSIYRYFASKDALVAAVQAEQLGELLAVLVAGRDRFDVDDERAVGLGPGVRALARVVLVGRLWIAAIEALPAEVRAARRLVLVPSPATAAATADLLRLLREPLDAAVAAGALEPADNDARVQVLVAGVVDAVLAAGAAVHGQQLFTCLLVAWGADPVALDQAADALGGAVS